MKRKIEFVGTTFATIVALLALPAPARANPDVTARLSEQGINLIASHFGYDRDNITLPDIDEDMGSCWPHDRELHVRDILIHVDQATATARAAPGDKIEVTLRGDFRGDAEVMGAYCVARATCDAELEVKNGVATATLTPVVEAGRLRLKNPQVDVQLSKSNVDIEFSSCGLADELFDLAYSLMEGRMVDWAEEELEKILLEDVVPDLESALSSLTQMGGPVDGYEVSGSATLALERDLEIGVTVQVQPTRQPSCALPPAPQPSAPTGTPSIAFNDEHLALAISSALFEKVSLAAWQSGALCLDSYAAMLGPNELATVAGFLGFEAIENVSAAALQPPTVTFNPASGADVTITLPSLTTTIRGTVQGAPTTVSVAATVAVDAAVDIDPFTKSLVLRKLAVRLENVGYDGNLPLGGIEQLFENLALPLVDQAMGRLELIPSIWQQSGNGLDDYYLQLTRAETSAAHVIVYVRLFRKPASDTLPPDTLFANQMLRVVKPGTFPVQVSGTDDQTPTGLLRYRFRVDGGPWSETTFSGEHRVRLTPGDVVIEAAAVDLNGNVDGSPARADLAVDGAPPTVTITDKPAAVIQTTGVHLGFKVEDDRTPSHDIDVEVVVERGEGAQATKVAEQPFAKGLVGYDLADLSDGRYTVTISARDGVGNLAQPVRVAFEVQTGADNGGGNGGDGNVDITPTTDPNAPAPDGNGAGQDPTTAGSGQGASGVGDDGLSGGCQLGGQQAPALPWTLALLLSLAWTLRRRRF